MNDLKKHVLAGVAGMLVFALMPFGQANAVQNRDHPSVKAALSCIEQIAPIVKNRDATGEDVSCDIPVSLSEQDLDELFKAAIRAASKSEKIRSTAEKYTGKFAKTLTNFRAADCIIKLRIKRSSIIEALTRDDMNLQLPDQPADCDVTTKKHKIQKLKFAFSPRLHMVEGCVADFALNMGKIDAGCKVCYFNRLFLSTKLVSLWANHLGDNAKRALNVQLGQSCR